MSLASRQRQSERRALHYRRGYPTWDAFREAQAIGLAAWLAVHGKDPVPDVLVRDSYGHTSQPARWFSTVGREPQVPLTFPEPDLTTNAEYLTD